MGSFSELYTELIAGWAWVLLQSGLMTVQLNIRYNHLTFCQTINWGCCQVRNCLLEQGMIKEPPTK